MLLKKIIKNFYRLIYRIIPVTAHAAFEKGAQYFKIKLLIKKKDKVIHSLTMFDKGGNRYKYTITKFVPNATPDILSELGEVKGERVLVGFAAETEDVIANAKDKLKRKAFACLAVAN